MLALRGDAPTHAPRARTRVQVRAAHTRARTRVHAAARSCANPCLVPRRGRWGGCPPGSCVTLAPGLGLCWMLTCTVVVVRWCAGTVPVATLTLSPSCHHPRPVPVIIPIGLSTRSGRELPHLRVNSPLLSQLTDSPPQTRAPQPKLFECCRVQNRAAETE